MLAPLKIATKQANIKNPRSLSGKINKAVKSIKNLFKK